MFQMYIEVLNVVWKSTCMDKMLMLMSQKLLVCIHIECGSFYFPEHHDCSEAQYSLLKEMTDIP